MRVSVVVCTYTDDLYEHAQDTADAVLNQSYDEVELILISDGSESVYESMCADYGNRSDVRVGYNKTNRGLSFSRNHGIELATGEIVAFVDDDAIPEPDWVERLVTAYRERSAIAVGGKMTPIWIDEDPNFLPEEFYWLVGVTHRGFPDEVCEVRNTNGSNMSFRSMVLEELGGFNEDLGRIGDRQVQGEETELAVRMYEQYDQRMWYIPTAKVGHKVFGYRTDRLWLLKRAFWQGYSKRVMSTFVDDTGSQESDFLKDLTVEFAPQRLVQLIKEPSIKKLDQLGMLVALTVAVGCGFLYGVLRH